MSFDWLKTWSIHYLDVTTPIDFIRNRDSDLGLID